MGGVDRELEVNATIGRLNSLGLTCSRLCRQCSGSALSRMSAGAYWPMSVPSSSASSFSEAAPFVLLWNGLIILPDFGALF